MCAMEQYVREEGWLGQNLKSESPGQYFDGGTYWGQGKEVLRW